MEFYKYQGTGNDFVMVDDRESTFPIDDVAYIAGLCHRRFGIGADGLICLRTHETEDFEMVYFNADGRQSSMCGNGGRCIVQFAHDLGVIGSTCSFMAIDGLHEAEVKEGLVSLKMIDVSDVQLHADALVLDTGSPHYVAFKQQIDQCDMKTEGSAIRYSADFSDEGINVNFVEPKGEELHMRTYERGVEDETFSCGTGVTAAVLAFATKNGQSSGHTTVHTKGGTLSLSFEKDAQGFKNIYLTGPATRVFKGAVE